MRTALINSLKMMVLTVILRSESHLCCGNGFTDKSFSSYSVRCTFPVVISATAIGLLFKLFYNYNGGMLNQILESIGAKPVNWLSPAWHLSWSVSRRCGVHRFYFVILLTGLSDITDDIYEAASIDGCSRFKQVFYITLPMMKPVFFTSVTLAVTGALKYLIFRGSWCQTARRRD